MTTEIINPPETDEEMFISYIDKIRKEVERAADKKLRSENRKLKAEIKALKSSSEPGSDC